MKTIYCFLLTVLITFCNPLIAQQSTHVEINKNLLSCLDKIYFDCANMPFPTLPFQDSPSVGVQNRKASVVYVKSDAEGNGDGSTWKDAYTDLQMAIDNASPGDQIWVTSGTYKPNIVNTPADSNYFLINKTLEIYGGFLGDEITLEERDWETNPTILSGDIKGDDIDDDFSMNKSDNVVHVILVGGNALLDGFHIAYGKTREGTAPNIGNHPWYGGGILGADFQVKNCIIRQNFAQYGGGIYAVSGQIINVENCLFENNHAVFFAGGLNIGNTNAKINNCNFNQNSIANETGSGAGIFIWQNESSTSINNTVHITNSQFNSNVSTYGAGLQLNNFNTGSVLKVDSCSFLNNHAEDKEGFGAAIQITNSNSQTKQRIHSLEANVSNSLFDGNVAKEGSALRVIQSVDTASFIFYNNVIKNCINSFDASLGIACVGDSKLYAALLSSSFDSNISSVIGGAVVMNNAQSIQGLLYNIDNCSFSNNNGGDYAGAIYSGNSQGGIGPKGQITNSIFESNFATLSCGAISSINEDLKMDHCSFNNNRVGYSASALCLTVTENQVGTSYLSNNNFFENQTINKSDTADHFWINNGAVEIWSEGLQHSTIETCSFLSNSSPNVGGALTIINEDSLLIKMNNCTFKENHSDQYGGAIFGTAHNNGDRHPSIIMDNNKIVNNNSEYGGGSYLSQVNMISNNSDYEDNEATSGGGSFCTQGFYHLNNCGFSKNKANEGAGLFLTNNSMTEPILKGCQIDSCIFSENEADLSGGGLSYSAVNGKSLVNIKHTQFRNNIAGLEGGAINYTTNSNNPLTTINGNLSIQNSVFINNVATRRGGGIAGLNQKDTLNLFVKDSEFDNNKISSNSSFAGGAAIFNGCTSTAGHYNYLISNTLFKNNISEGISGAIWNAADQSANAPQGKILNCQFSNNEAKGCCAAIGSSYDDMFIDQCRFIGNKSPVNGAIGTIRSKNLVLKNSIFKENSAQSRGSVLRILETENTLIENCLMHNNSGTHAIYTDSKVDIYNSTISSNELGMEITRDADIYLQNTIFDNKINLKKALFSTNESGGGNISSDRSMMSFLKGNGSYQDYNNIKPGLDANFVPIKDSPCVDSGNPNNISESKDLAGNNRIQGNNIDIGAYESPFMTSINEAVWDDELMNVFPNPVPEFLHVNLNISFEGMADFNVYNSSGQLVLKTLKSISTNVTTYQLDVNSLRQGSYYLILSTSDKTFAQNFVKM